MYQNVLKKRRMNQINPTQIDLRVQVHVIR